MTQNVGNFWDVLTLKGAGRQTIDNSSTFGVPLKFLRYNGSWAMWKVGGIKFHDFFFLRKTVFNTRISWAWIFSETVPTKSLRTHGSEYVG